MAVFLTRMDINTWIILILYFPIMMLSLLGSNSFLRWVVVIISNTSINVFSTLSWCVCFLHFLPAHGLYSLFPEFLNCSIHTLCFLNLNTTLSIFLSHPFVQILLTLVFAYRYVGATGITYPGFCLIFAIF